MITSRGIKSSCVVLYQGVISSERCIDEIVAASEHFNDGVAPTLIGQVIFGLPVGHRAGDDGSWKQFTFSGKTRTYYSRVAHALAELWKVTGDARYRDGAMKQLRWVVQQQTDRGSFRNCSFTEDDMTVLHVIAYTLDGLWKAGEILGEKEFQEASRCGVAALARIQKEKGVIAGHYDPEWRATDPARCLTGLAQMAEVWLLIHRADRNPAFLGAADTAIEFLKQKQIIAVCFNPIFPG